MSYHPAPPSQSVSHTVAATEVAISVPLPQLPLELWGHIFYHLKDDSQGLGACSLTCWAWTSAARPHLFHAIRLRYKEDCMRLHSVLQSSKVSGGDVARYVREINMVRLQVCSPVSQHILVNQSEDDILEVLHALFCQLPYVRSLKLDNVDLLVDFLPSTDLDGSIQPQSFSYLFPFPHLRSLVLSAVTFTSRDNLVRLLVQFPRLSSLSICHLSWWGRNIHQPAEPFALESLRGVLQHLDQLILVAIPTSTIDRLRKSLLLLDIGNMSMEEEECLFLELLQGLAPVIQDLDLSIRPMTKLLGKHNQLQFRRLQTLHLHLRISYHLAPITLKPLPSFLCRLGSERTKLRSLDLGFRLLSPTQMNWTLLDWSQVDKALMSLYQCNPKLIVTFIFIYISKPSFTHQALMELTAAPLADRLAGVLGAGLRIGVECDFLSRGPPMPVTRGGLHRWLS